MKALRLKQAQDMYLFALMGVGKGVKTGNLEMTKKWRARAQTMLERVKKLEAEIQQ